jgi:hypothetical protein
MLHCNQQYIDCATPETLTRILLCIAGRVWGQLVSESERMRMKKLEELNKTVDSL